MEDSVFQSEAVASLMKQHVVEGRLHTDSQKTLSEEQFAKNRETQKRIAGVFTNPYFVMVDPHTGNKVGEFNLSGGFGSWEAKWIAWIKAMAAKSGR